MNKLKLLLTLILFVCSLEVGCTAEKFEGSCARLFRAQVIEIVRIADERSVEDCDLVQFNAAWRVVFAMRASFEKGEWRRMNTEIFSVAVRDLSGQLRLSNDGVSQEDVFLLVEYDKGCIKIHSVQRVSDEFVRSIENNGGG